MRIKRNNGAIPRKTLQARHVTEGYDAYGYPTGLTYVPFEALVCTVQPIQGKDLLLLPEGMRDKEAYTVWTETECDTVNEGTDKKPDEIQIYGDWYKVTKKRSWQVGLIPHYELVVVKRDEGLEPQEVTP